MALTRRLLFGLLPAILIFAAPAARSAAAAPQAAGPSEVRLTWLSIANWLFEVGGTRIVTDGYITRIPQSAFTGVGTLGLDFSFGPVTPDVETVSRVVGALGGKRRVDYILTGHSHFDHSFDTALWAKLTGAHIIGARSTCYQAFAQGVPRSQCTVVEGGETIGLGGGLTVHAIRTHHSGFPGTQADLHEPLELTEIPTADPVTGGLRPGVLEDFPNGGGSRGFLFTVDTPRGRLSWVYFDSTNPFTFDEPVVLDGVDYGTPRANIAAAMAEAGLTSVDLLIQNSDAAFAQLVAPILRPKAFIPQHWDGLFEPFLAGLPFPFANPSLEAFLAGEGVALLPQRQYMDAYRLTPKGVTPLPNHDTKQKLGFSDVQEF